MANLNNLEKEVHNNFKELKNIINSNSADTERFYTRKIEHKAYLCAATCTSDKSLSTKENSDCVANCLQKIFDVQKLFQSRTNMVNNALGKCMKECQDAAVDGLADDASDAEVEVGRRDRGKRRKLVFSTQYRRLGRMGRRMRRRMPRTTTTTMQKQTTTTTTPSQQRSQVRSSSGGKSRERRRITT